MSGLRRIRALRRWIRPETASALAVAVVLTALGVAVALLWPAGAHPTATYKVRSGLAEAATPSPSDSSAPPTPAVVDPVSAEPTPAMSTTTRVGQTADAQPTPKATTAAASASPTRTAELQCVGPLPQGHISVPSCDTDNKGLPPDCGPTSCVWPDAWGATPAGPYEVTAEVTAAGGITVSWNVTADDLSGDVYALPITEFVVRIFEGTSAITLDHQYEVGLDARTYTTPALPPGTYTACAYDLNGSGLSSGECVAVSTAPSPSPTTPVAPSATTSS